MCSGSPLFLERSRLALFCRNSVLCLAVSWPLPALGHILLRVSLIHSPAPPQKEPGYSNVCIKLHVSFLFSLPFQMDAFLLLLLQGPTISCSVSTSPAPVNPVQEYPAGLRTPSRSIQPIGLRLMKNSCHQSIDPTVRRLSLFQAPSIERRPGQRCGRSQRMQRPAHDTASKGAEAEGSSNANAKSKPTTQKQTHTTIIDPHYIKSNQTET